MECHFPQFLSLEFSHERDTQPREHILLSYSLTVKRNVERPQANIRTRWTIILPISCGFASRFFSPQQQHKHKRRDANARGILYTEENW